jgi:hypothetical protein
MNTYFVSFRKFQPKGRTIRLEIAITAATKHEARTIAEKELARPAGYRYEGIN